MNAPYTASSVGTVEVTEGIVVVPLGPSSLNAMPSTGVPLPTSRLLFTREAAEKLQNELESALAVSSA